MISRVDVTLPIPSIPMPAWAHQWLTFIIALATIVSSTIAIWGPGVGLSISDISLAAGIAIAVVTVFRGLDAASETIVKNAEVTALANGAVAIASTTNRPPVLTNAVLPQATLTSEPPQTITEVSSQTPLSIGG